MKTVRYERTLFYYDGPQVFEARDTIGGHYIAVAVAAEPRSGMAPQQDKPDERYLVVGVAPESLRQFRGGATDLRSLLVGSDEDQRYVATPENGTEDMLQLIRLTTPLLESGYLPDEGFLLYDTAPREVCSKEPGSATA